MYDTSALVASVPEDARKRLYGFAAAAENVDWPGGVAGVRGWPAANESYHAHQRALGRAEMAALMLAMGIGPAVPLSRMRETVLTAIGLLLKTEHTHAEAFPHDDGIRIEATSCPLYDRISDRRWHGLSACGCFPRLLGWQDALGINADMELLANRKWGDETCCVVLHLPGPPVDGPASCA